MTEAILPLATIAQSRPSPWALPLTFAEAVLDPAHDAHKEAMAQWRGLLAIIALQNLHGADYGLSVREAAVDAGSPLAHMLSAHRPATALPNGEELWDRPHLAMLHRADQVDGVMAMINPLCLISPGASSGWVWPEFGWLAGGLADPLAGAGALPFTELALLASWLSVVEGALRQSGPGGDGAAAAALCEQVHKYRADCLSLLGPIAIDVACERPAGCPLPMPFAALFTEARIAAIADPAAMAMGRIALPSSGAPWPMGLIVADPALCAHYGQDARQIIIWGARSLSEIMADPALLAATKAEVADAGWLLVTADDLFTRRMVSLGQQGCVPSHTDDFAGAVMPLRPLVLLLGEQLGELASCEWGDAAATVTLALPMDNGRYLSISREYRTDAPAEAPLWVQGGEWAIHGASVWPDFRSDAFHHYTARLTHNDRFSGRGAMRAVSVLSRDLILAELAARDSRMDAVAALHSLNEGRALYAARGRIETQSAALAGEQESVWRSTLPFEAIGWVDHNAVRGDDFCGLVLLNLPDAPVSNLSVKAAVDFGTTNTVACFDDGAAIRFADRLLVPIQSDSSGFTRARLHDRRYHYARFYPLGRRALPTPSVTIGRGAEAQSAGGVFRNVIFFPLLDAEIENGEAQELALLAREMQSCHFNLKWSDALTDVDASSDFLEQTLWMIAAEAAALGHDPAAIQWRFSVPDAMAIKRRRHFERMLEDLTARVGGTMAPVVSEGLAAATHMLAGGDTATQQLLTLVIDIGGGTSDIAIWDGSDVAWKGSFRLAGQDFFTRTLNRNPAILDGMGLSFWGRMLGQDVAGVRAETLVHVAELLFSGNRLADAMADHWDDHLARDGGAVLRMAGLTYLGGMAWYLGRVTRQLLRQNALHYGAQSRPAFALCGRGAGLFRFMHGALDPLDDSLVTDALTLFSIAAELDNEPRPQLLLTQDAKIEVVRGMMTPAPRFARAAKIWNGDGEGGGAIPAFQPSGLSLHYPGGASVQADAAFDTAAMAGRALHMGFDEMDAFLKALSHCAGLYIDVRHGVPQSAWDRMEHDVLAAMEDARYDDGRTPLEPPFIIALRRLLSELTDPAAREQGRVVAEFIG